MTEERNRPASASDQDALVTETYRDMADERTPAHLDQAVFRTAARAVRPKYSRLIAWTRPMAWAATVMLTVTLVLQITDIPAPEAVVFEARPAKNEDIDPVAIESELEKRQRDVTSQGRAERKDSAPATSVDEFKLKNLELLRQAEDMARMQLGESDQPETSQAAASLSKASPACNSSAIATPDTWLECIAELEQAGLADVAREQRQLLGEAFPAFESP